MLLRSNAVCLCQLKQVDLVDRGDARKRVAEFDFVLELSSRRFFGLASVDVDCRDEPLLGKILVTDDDWLFCLFRFDGFAGIFIGRTAIVLFRLLVELVFPRPGFLVGLLLLCCGVGFGLIVRLGGL